MEEEECRPSEESWKVHTYHGKRLELNEEVAAKIRRVFMIGNVTLELSAVVVVQQDESRVEGIKVKFGRTIFPSSPIVAALVIFRFIVG